MSLAAKRQLQGVLPVLHTPFTDAGAIDTESLQREIDWAFSLGADGAVIGMVNGFARCYSLYHGTCRVSVRRLC